MKPRTSWPHIDKVSKRRSVSKGFEVSPLGRATFFLRHLSWPPVSKHQGNHRPSAASALVLVRLLPDVDQTGATGETERAWVEELRARVNTVDEGRVVGIAYEQINKGNGRSDSLRDDQIPIASQPSN